MSIISGVENQTSWFINVGSSDIEIILNSPTRGQQYPCFFEQAYIADESSVCVETLGKHRPYSFSLCPQYCTFTLHRIYSCVNCIHTYIWKETDDNYQMPFPILSFIHADEVEHPKSIPHDIWIPLPWSLLWPRSHVSWPWAEWKRPPWSPGQTGIYAGVTDDGEGVARRSSSLLIGYSPLPGCQHVIERIPADACSVERRDWLWKIDNGCVLQ